MKLGKCISVDTGYLGCSADVRTIVSERCNGKQRCQIDMPDEGIKSSEPCHKGVGTYLETAYVCIPGKTLIFGRYSLAG